MTPTQSDSLDIHQKLDNILKSFHNLDDRFSGNSSSDWEKHVAVEREYAREAIEALYAPPTKKERAMTPTEQDKELREQELSTALLELVQEGVKYGYNNNSNGLYHELTESQCRYANEAIGSVMALITADRKRVALEARIDELTRVLQRPYISQQVYGQERIAELKAQQEEK